MLLEAQTIDFQALNIMIPLYHQRALSEKDHEKTLAHGITLPLLKVVSNGPFHSAIARRLQQMPKNERQTVKKLNEIAFFIALKGYPFTNLQDHIEIEKLHGVKYTVAYENESASKDFMFCISEYQFDKSVRKKLKMVNFIAILCDGSADKRITEYEVVCALYIHLESGKPTFAFSKVGVPSDT